MGEMMHSNNQPYKQQGFSLSSMLFWSVVVVLIAVLGMKVVPVYIENASIKKNLIAMSNDSSMQNASAAQIRQSFTKRAQVDNITAIKARDIKILREKGQIVLSTNYSVNVPLFANISLLIDFDTQSE